MIRTDSNGNTILGYFEDGGRILRSPEGRISAVNAGISTSDPTIIQGLLEGVPLADVMREGWQRSAIQENPTLARAVTAQQGIPFIGEWFDELYGLVGGPEAAEGTRFLQESMAEQRPLESLALQVGTGVAATAPLAIAAAPAVLGQGTSLASQTLRGLAAGTSSGAVEGAVAGAGANEENRLGGAQSGAILGGALGGTLGAAAPAVISGGTALARGLRDSLVRRPSETPQGATTQPVSEALPDTPDVGTPPVLSTLPEERPRAVIREDNTYRGSGTVRTNLSANEPSPFATRTTAQSQIDDMIFSGVVRPPEGGFRGEAIMYFGRYDNELPTSVFNRPNPSKPYTIVARGETVAGKEGPIPIDELLHVWTIKDGEYVDILPEILQRNKDYSEASGDTTPNFSEGGEVTKNMETQMSTLLQEGGIADDGMTTDPVSGNEIPPGSMAEEVRDDVDAKLSQGEYVVPADVVRFFGVAFFEGLRNKAKEGLAEMESNGRIGGEPALSEPPMRELPMREPMPAEMQMAKGGDVGIDKDARKILESLKRSPQLRERLQRSGVTIKMAEGGDVGTQTQSAFRVPFQNVVGFSTLGSNMGTAPQQNIEYKTYENAAGDTRVIMFLNGQPQQPIPQGFYPQGEVPKEEEKERKDEDPNLIAPTQAAPRTPAVNLYGMNEDELSTWAQGGIGGSFLSGAGGLIGTAADLDAISRVRAAAMVAADQGYTALQTQLESSAAEMQEDLGWLGDLLQGTIATGEQYYEDQQQFRQSRVPSTPVTPQGSSTRRAEPIAARQATGQSRASSISGTTASKPAGYTPVGGGSKASTPQPAPTQSKPSGGPTPTPTQSGPAGGPTPPPRPQTTPEPTYAGNSYSQYTSMAKGGLIKRPNK